MSRTRANVECMSVPTLTIFKIICFQKLLKRELAQFNLSVLGFFLKQYKMEKEKSTSTCFDWHA